MSAHTLQYRSPERSFKPQNECSPHSSFIRDWKVSETYEPNAHNDRREGFGRYQLVLEKPVSTQEEVWASLSEADLIAEELDVAWCYVCKSPFFAMRETVVGHEEPTGWRGNTREIEREIEKAKGGYYFEAVQVASSHWFSPPFLPLKKVLVVRDAVLKATPEIKNLIELHIAAHKSDKGSLFFLAKGLELSRALFGGGNRTDQNARLQAEMENIDVAPHLTQSVNWLFDIANSRFDIRHVVNGYSPVVVHPRLNDTERQDFKTNADLVIRSVICTQLDIDIYV